MTPRIHRKAVTRSTNADAREGSHGDVFVADFQTAGRGRLDHSWLAAAGENLTFSAVLDVAGLDPARAATLPLVVGLAVARAVAPLLPDTAGNDLAIKWPNDVMLRGRKLAGILCERNGDCVVAGVGLNVNQTGFPPEIAERATSLALTTGGCFQRDELLSRVLSAIYSEHARWRKGGFAACRRDFAALDFLAGKVVSVRQTDDDPSPVSGVCGGVQDDGSLLVGGVSVHAGEAHLMPVSKADVRREMRRLRRSVDAATREARSKEVCTGILARDDFRTLVAERRTFALYLATADELDLHDLFDALWRAGCETCAPAWNAAVREYRLAKMDAATRLVAGPMGVMQPDAAPEVRPADVAAWIVPGLAFDSRGRRIGYGGGWYDRLLSNAAPGALKLGVCHSFQLLREVPSEPHDATLSGVVAARRGNGIILPT